MRGRIEMVYCFIMHFSVQQKTVLYFDATAIYPYLLTFICQQDKTCHNTRRRICNNSPEYNNEIVHCAILFKI